MRPSALRLVEYCDALRWNVIVADKGVAVFVNNLNESGRRTQGVCLCYSVAAVLRLLNAVAGESLLQYLNKRKVAGEKNRVFALGSI